MSFLLSNFHHFIASFQCSDQLGKDGVERRKQFAFSAIAEAHPDHLNFGIFLHSVPNEVCVLCDDDERVPFGVPPDFFVSRGGETYLEYMGCVAAM